MTNSTWKVTPAEAIALQQRLRKNVQLMPLTKPIHHVGGCDVSMNLYATEGFAGFVTLSYPKLEIVDHAVVKDAIDFPYIPGLLSFREIPMLLKAWERLQVKPDVLVVDGVGIAHPRRLGIASHLGLELGIPTIGCAKSVLIGIYEEPGNEPGSVSFLYDRLNTEEIIGVALRTKRGVKPVFISPGHLISLEESLRVVKNCIRVHRLPEPTRFAHRLVNVYRAEATSEKSRDILRV